MIKSKNPVLIDSRTQEQAVIYFSCPIKQEDDTQQLVSYLVSAFKLVDETFVEIARIPAVYKMATWLALFGDLTTNQMNAQKDDLMIQQIGLNSAQYWGLTSEDLENV